MRCPALLVQAALLAEMEQKKSVWARIHHDQGTGLEQVSRVIRDNYQVDTIDPDFFP